MRLLKARLLGAGLLVTLGCGARATVTSRTQPLRREVHITGFRFMPESLTVRVGDSLVFVNDDGFPHTSTANGGAWSSPELGRGERHAILAPPAGRYPYHCAAHPSMTALLRVE